MRVLTAEQMREVDRLTIEAGIPGIVLMENAAHRVVEYVAAKFAPLSAQRIVILCGKGNNGGDGLAIARQLATRFTPQSLDVVLLSAELTGDAAANLRMLRACGIEPAPEITAGMHPATLVIDAVLGTGIRGGASGRALDFIRAINEDFPLAKVVAVDLPSGMDSNAADSTGVCARADATVTFTAPKICHALPPNCDRLGELKVAQIGSSPHFYDTVSLALIEPAWFASMFQPRPRSANKGNFGHVLAIAGSVGKTGAAAMTAEAALRSGAGLVTVATPASAVSAVASHTPELMTEPLPETETGAIANRAYPTVESILERKNVVAAGPGFGTHPETVAFVRTLYDRVPVPMVVDADALNALAQGYVHPGGPRILTPHPGEMARLCECTVAQVQADRVGVAVRYATDRKVVVVLKGQRTVIAFPDGRAWINPTGTPAMATAGTGDILTGMIAGLLAQFASQPDLAVAAAVWLHGRSGELASAVLGECCVIATDLLRYLPEAIGELSHGQ